MNKRFLVIMDQKQNSMIVRAQVKSLLQSSGKPLPHQFTLVLSGANRKTV